MTKLLLFLAVSPIVVFGDCNSIYQGTWVQESYNHQPQTYPMNLVITDLKPNCEFVGTFDGSGFRHEMTGTIGENANGGSLKVRRTDPNGCVTLLFGRIYKLGRAVITVGMEQLLELEIASTEGKCGVPAGLHEWRTFHKAGTR